MTAPLRVLIAEDEATIARRVARLTREIVAPRECEITIAGNLEEARAAVTESCPELLLLDLALEGDEGFELLHDPRLKRIPTIVVSAHTTRALEGFEHGVRDFVAKPFGRARLELAFRRALEPSTTDAATTPLVAARVRGTTDVIPVDQVIYVRAVGATTELVLAGGRTMTCHRSLAELERTLPSRFVRIHRSLIVDVSRALRLVAEEGSRYRLALRDGPVLPVGRSRLSRVREQMS